MTPTQILWGVLSFIFIAGFFFFRVWIMSIGKSLDKMEERLNLKLDAIVCVERNTDIKTACHEMARHKHAPVRANGEGGEVIIPS